MITTNDFLDVITNKIDVKVYIYDFYFGSGLFEVELEKILDTTETLKQI